MKLARNVTLMLAMTGIAAPALADTRSAAFLDSSDRRPAEISTFAGATLRLRLNRNDAGPRYRAALGISGMARTSGAADTRVGRGLELAFAGKGKPQLSLAGRELGEIGNSLKLGGGGKTALIVLGAAAAIGVAALVVVDSARCEDEGNTCD